MAHPVAGLHGSEWNFTVALGELLPGNFTAPVRNWPLSLLFVLPCVGCIICVLARAGMARFPLLPCLPHVPLIVRCWRADCT